jgi:hypothetical protein
MEEVIKKNPQIERVEDLISFSCEDRDRTSVRLLADKSPEFIYFIMGVEIIQLHLLVAKTGIEPVTFGL